MFETSVWTPGGSDEDRGEIHAAVYARTSSASQRYGYSLDEQIRLCLERCKMNRWRPAFIFQDEGESGRDVDRPQFQQLMDKAERQLFDVVVFWKLDRFSRSLLHVVQLEKQLREWGVALHSVTEQINTTSSSGRFNFRNIASAAEFERDMIKERTKMGHTALAMQGKWPNNSPPIGYDLDESGRLIVNQTEAALVQDIFEEYLSAKSMPDVAEWLNKAGFVTQSGVEWCARSVGAVLRNRIYTGRYEVAGVHKQFPEYRIVEDELFESVTTVRNRFKSGSGHRRSMPRQRKNRFVSNVFKQYEKFVSHQIESCDR